MYYLRSNQIKRQIQYMFGNVRSIIAERVFYTTKSFIVAIPKELLHFRSYLDGPGFTIRTSRDSPKCILSLYDA